MTTPTYRSQDPWQPLEGFAERHPEINPADFMFMGHPANDEIHAYKHVDTRRYLNLTPSTDVYAYRPDAGGSVRGYVEIDEAHAIVAVLS